TKIDASPSSTNGSAHPTIGPTDAPSSAVVFSRAASKRRSFAIADQMSAAASTMLAMRLSTSDLETAVPAAVKYQRLALGCVAEFEHLADHDDVVTGVVLRLGFAIDECEQVAEDRRAAAAVRVLDVLEAVRAALGEQPADLFVVFAENVDGPLAGALDTRPSRRRLRRTEQHERRIERQRRERVARHADGLVAVERGDDADARREVPEHGAKRRGIRSERVDLRRHAYLSSARRT